MTTYSFPSDARNPSSQNFGVISKDGIFQSSPFSAFQQAFARTGAQLTLSLQWNNLDYTDAQQLQGFFLNLKGKENRMTIQDFQYQVVGTITGTPKINGASQGGSSIITDGWTNGITLKRGNRISWSNGNGHDELKFILQDTVVDGTGNATIPVWPDIHTAPANNADIEITTPIGTYRLLSNPFVWTNLTGDRTNFSAELIEGAP